MNSDTAPFLMMEADLSRQRSKVTLKNIFLPINSP